MSQMTAHTPIPSWTLGWRMQRSLAHADISVQEMQAHLGVSRSTISRWMHDKGQPPKRAYVPLLAAFGEPLVGDTTGPRPSRRPLPAGGCGAWDVTGLTTR